MRTKLSVDVPERPGPPALAGFARELRATLTPSQVLSAGAELSRYTDNTSHHDRRVPLVVVPRDVAQVRAAVAAAVRYRVPLHPISGGRNWGLGSALPTVDGTSVLDLSGLDRIRLVDPLRKVAIIEAGVTQGQLADHLARWHPELVMDVTGAPRCTTVVGNLLDRGVGYIAPRSAAVHGLEVVLANGRTIRTGGWRLGDATQPGPVLGHGAGPDLGDLFVQGNFGVVTACLLSLRRRPRAQVALVMSVDAADRLPGFLDRLASLYEQGVLTSVAHVANRARAESSFLPLGAGPSRMPQTAAIVERGYYTELDIPAWTVAVEVGGPPRVLRARVAEARSRLRGHARVSVVSRRRVRAMRGAGTVLAASSRGAKLISLARALDPLLGIVSGRPTDDALAGLAFPLADAVPVDARDPDRGQGGLVFSLRTCAFDGRSAERLVQLVSRVSRQEGFVGHLTLNVLTPATLEAVINVCFDRGDDGATARAHRWEQRMELEGHEAGFPAYRASVSQMQRVVLPDDPFWSSVQDLRRGLDPFDLIAPGRYAPTERHARGPA